MRKEIIRKNQDTAKTERDRKAEDALRIQENREANEGAKRDLRNAMFQTRYADEEKVKLMSAPNKSEAAALVGITLPPTSAVSPYRLM